MTKLPCLVWASFRTLQNSLSDKPQMVIFVGRCLSNARGFSGMLVTRLKAMLVRDQLLELDSAVEAFTG